MAKWSNKGRLLRKMSRLPPAVIKAVEVQLAKNADELVATAKGFAPVDEGELRDSIEQRDTSEPGKPRRQVRVTAKDEKGRPYPRWVEHGTKDTPARPFLFPAYRLKRRRFKSRLTRAAKKAIGEAIK